MVNKYVCDNSFIFKYINPESNDRFSEMNGTYLQDIIILLDNFYLELRKKLGLNKSITFGTELEFEDIDKEVIRNMINDELLLENWIIKSDCSIICGGEVNSPILRDSESSWDELKKVCLILDENAKIGNNSAGHIHVGSQILGDDRQSWLNFIKLWSVYENIIFRFGYGEFLVGRQSIMRYAKPIKDYLWEYYNNFIKDNVSLENMLVILSLNRDQAVNFTHVLKDNIDSFNLANTIEFRSPNASFNPEIWQNNVNFFTKLLLYSCSSLYDDDKIENRNRLDINKNLNYEMYNQVFLDQALELCDMIFDNNLDKIYFLKQYLKSFEVGDKSNIKTYSLVKK